MKKKTYKEILKENEILTEAVIDFHYMARRYADGRMTYAANIVNDHTYKLLQMGIVLSPDGFEESLDGTFFAHDGQENIERNCFCIPKHFLELEKEILNGD